MFYTVRIVNYLKINHIDPINETSSLELLWQAHIFRIFAVSDDLLLLTRGTFVSIESILIWFTIYISLYFIQRRILIDWNVFSDFYLFILGIIINKIIFRWQYFYIFPNTTKSCSNIEFRRVETLVNFVINVYFFTLVILKG